ncbi:MAG: HEAT repeat domain-containing protein [Desulfatitalea sp.]|nr:HEAT repeat domain-containing protein [Desulfatitalea sp.]MBI5896954.1 HEAT repeat domain-containing protein [Desulfobacterales bacterium]
MAIRLIKQQVAALLRADDLPSALAALAQWPPRQVVSPLIGLLYHGEPRVRWHAVAALGQVVARLADEEIEAARVVMRRLMWSLNDESGGIGWGAPEAMGEIMANHERLAREYACILVSYLNPDGNFLEHEGLQQGVLWGLGRLAQAQPALVAPAAPFIRPYLASAQDRLRGMAAWAAGHLREAAAPAALQALLGDPTLMAIFDQGRLTERTIGEMSRAALG